jgi:hypothetical protein
MDLRLLKRWGGTDRSGTVIPSRWSVATNCTVGESGVLNAALKDWKETTF